MPWRRAFVDLYTIARWLDEYVEVIRTLPRIIRERGTVSLNDVLRPSFSPVIMPLVSMPPRFVALSVLDQLDGQEMMRQGVYAPQDADTMATYSWAPSQRVRKLLNSLGARVGDWADKEASRAIHAFVFDHIGETRARFVGDFDLPLQLITRELHEAALIQCFNVVHLDPPDFDSSDDFFGRDQSLRRAANDKQFSAV